MLLCHEHGLNQSGNLLDDPVHAHGRIHGRIHFVMMRAGVQDQNPGSSVRLLHHVGQVMAIVLGQGRAENDEIKRITAQGLEHALAIEGRRNVMTSLGHFGGLRGEGVLIGLSIKNFDGGLGGFLTGRGQSASYKVTSRLATGGVGSEITEDQDLRGTALEDGVGERVYGAISWAARCRAWPMSFDNKTARCSANTASESRPAW